MNEKVLINQLIEVSEGDRKLGLQFGLANYDNIDSIENELIGAIDVDGMDYLLGIGTVLGIIKGNQKVIHSALKVVKEAIRVGILNSKK